MGGRGSPSRVTMTVKLKPGDSSESTKKEAEASKKKPITLEEYLGPKGNPMNSVEAAKGTNPNFMSSVRSGDMKYTHNCQRCVWATELRRRGYDVEAMARTSDNSYASMDTSKPHSFLNVSKTPIQLDSYGSMWYKATAKEVKDGILKHGEGSRGMLIMTGLRSGHVCNWEVKNGKVLIYDGQSNRTHSMTELKKSFYKFYVGRMDNIPMSDISDPLVRDFVKRSGT